MKHNKKRNKMIKKIIAKKLDGKWELGSGKERKMRKSNQNSKDFQ